MVLLKSSRAFPKQIFRQSDVMLSKATREIICKFINRYTVNDLQCSGRKSVHTPAKQVDIRSGVSDRLLLCLTESLNGLGCRIRASIVKCRPSHTLYNLN